MRKNYRWLLLTLLMMSFAQAQIAGSLPLGDNKWRIGGAAGLGGSFGNNAGWSISLSPRVGYALTPEAEVGLVGSFAYTKSDWFTSTHTGIGPFAQYYLGSRFFGSVMFQQYFFNITDRSTQNTFSRDESALFLGGGYLQPIGARTFFQIGLMYNVLYKEKTSFLNSALVPNAGIVVGL